MDGRLFYFFCLLDGQPNFSPTHPYSTAEGTVFGDSNIRPHPNWTTNHLLIGSLGKKKKKRELISCPRLCEGTLLLHMSRVTGVNSATRGRFTGTESNHRSAVLCLSRPVQTETFRTVVAMKIELKIMDRKGHVLGHSLLPVLSIPL